MTARTSTTTAATNLHVRSLSALLLIGALALSACSTEGSTAGFTEGEDSTEQAAATEETADQATAESSPETSDDASADNNGESDDENGASDTQISADDAEETVTYNIPTGDIDGTITVGFHSLKERGDTMELTLTYTPEFEGGDAYSLYHLHSNDHAMVAPALFDRENLKRYDILRVGPTWDSENVWNSRQAVTNLNSGDTQVYQATFAAPQDDIDTINVSASGAPEFEDVQIERDGDSATSEETTEEEN